MEIKAKVIDAIEMTAATIRGAALREAGKDENAGADCKNWNLKNHVCHINDWIDFSCRKLTAIKNRVSFDEIENIDEFNIASYEKSKETSLIEAMGFNKKSIDKLVEIVKIHNDDELMRNDFPTGFHMQLWQYMSMDGFIHPHKHVMYYYLIKERADEFLSTVNMTEEHFKWYSNGDDEVYSFAEFFNSKSECVRFFEKTNIRRLDQAGDLIDRIIEINMI